MLKKFVLKSALGAAAVVTLVTFTGCGGKTTAKIQGGGTGGGGNEIQKGVEQKPAMSDDEQFAILFSELQWSRQAAFYSLNVPNSNSVKGCATYRVSPKLSRFLMTDYDCQRVSDSSDLTADRQFELTGRMTFTKARAEVTYAGTLNSKSINTLTNEVVGLGELNRVVKISDSSIASRQPLTASVIYDVTGKTGFLGGVAKDSGRLGEEWATDFVGGFSAPDTNPTMTLVAGSMITLSYKPETPKVTTVRREQQIELIAQTDAPFISTGGCLRPVGTFEWRIGSGASARKGLIVATAAGFARSDAGGTVHPWGSRCLER